MKIIVTGSLGHISKPLTQELVEKGHEVTVISSQPERQKDIENMGARAAIGSLEDADFLAKTFQGADAAYCMVPPGNYFDPNLDLLAYYRRFGGNYAEAIRQTGVKRVVNLSTIGGNMEKGNGILLGAHDVEEILNELPADVSITHMRPTSFYYNLYAYTDSIKNQNVIAANYGGEDIVPWVSPIDIAAAIAEEIETPEAGRRVRYVASDERSCNDTASILGAAIGKPDLKWTIITDEQMQSGLEAAGMNPRIAAGLVEMYAGFHSGTLAEDYHRNKPKVLGGVKLEDFANEFAAVFNRQ
jgi:uncharacterized protein YbjT (DUF2867 family)